VNTFVARFIGSPSMNVLPAGALGIGGDGQLAGFRPEHVELGNGRPDTLSYDALVEVVEYLGDEQLAHVRLLDQDVVVKLPDTDLNAPGLVGGVLGTVGTVVDGVLPDCGCAPDSGLPVALPLPVLGH